MKIRSLAVLLLMIASLGSCTKAQQDRARARAHQAERKLDEAGRKLKHDAERFTSRTTGDGDALRPDTPRVEDKLRGTAKKTRAEADRLAIVARAKAALANQVGLKTLSSVSVESDGSTVTLSGRVTRAEDKARAQEVVSGLSGVTHVVNRIEVE